MASVSPFAGDRIGGAVAFAPEVCTGWRLGGIESLLDTSFAHPKRSSRDRSALGGGHIARCVAPLDLVDLAFKILTAPTS
eukprot:6482944-Amphidinium_carterae.1